MLQGATAQTGIGLQRRGKLGLTAQGAADELVGKCDTQDQQRDDDGDPDRLIDQEGGQRHIAAEHAADDEGHEEPSQAAQRSANVHILGNVGPEAGFILRFAGCEAPQQLGEDQSGRQGEDRSSDDGDGQGRGNGSPCRRP